MFYYAVVSMQMQQQRQDIIASTSQLRKRLTDTMDELHRAHPQIPQFISSLFPLVDCHEQHDSDDDCAANHLLRHQLANKIFAFWEEIIITLPFADLDCHSFVSHFLQRAHSPLLHKEWLLAKSDFNTDTQIFGDLLFEHAQGITNPCADSFLSAAKKIEKHPEFLRMMFE
ncbi:MAG TPA: hypothetical protein VLG50_07505 [Candidatus Saccharimonadales bacterium]|nr:hypothetical protein [Candidatus Saccharimonadales bacterium]